MAVEFSEYRGKRKRSFHKRRFPLIRLLFLLLLVVLAQVFGLFRKVVEALPLGVNEPVVVELTWKTVCDSSRGTFDKLKNGLQRCEWNLNDSIGTLPTSFLRYVVSIRSFGASRVAWIADSNDFTTGKLVRLQRDSVNHDFVLVEKGDSTRYWIDADNGCRFPGLCPRRPLGLAAVPISGNFDFEGQESLLATDVFIGAGDAPVYPVLPGVVLDAGKDSLGYFVEIDHGDNLTTRTSGMGVLTKPLYAGDSIAADVSMGRLLSQDSATFFLTVRQNGLFVRWNDIYEYSHPVDSSSIAIFKKRIGL